MAIKALCADESDNVHLLLGLNRENLESILRGDTFYFPAGALPLNEKSEIALVFRETDEELGDLLPANAPVS